MTRRFRDRTSSTWLHIYNRGVNGCEIFTQLGDQHMFEEMMGESSADYGVEVHAYALMTNHFHVLVHVDGGGVSEWVRYFCGMYAAAYNVRTGRTGPLFNGRFGSVAIVEDGGSDRQLVAVGRYIHRNPLAFIRLAALPNYVHSSLGVYLDRRAAPSWLHTGTLSALPSAIMLTAELGRSDETDLAPPPGFEPIRTVAVDEIARAVEMVGAEFAAPERRMLAMTLAVELQAGAMVELSGRFGVAPDSVARAARRGRLRLEADERLRRARTAALVQLAA